MSEDGHYDDIATTYENAFFYSSPSYQQWVLDKIVLEFEQATRTSGTTNANEVRLADVGGGTGNFTQALAEHMKLNSQALCVDPYLTMLKAAERHPRVKTLHMDAMQFSQGLTFRSSISHMLMKEVVHHIPVSQYPEVFAGLYQQLCPGGVLVVITRPQEVHYPFFKLAFDVWRENQPSQEEISGAMAEGGFIVSAAAHEYPAQLSKQTWFDMVKNRFWSTFSKMSDEQLQAGLQELAQQYQGRDTVDFVDRLLFIVGTKTKDSAGSTHS